ncbi:hypothetical protein Fcan01_14459 [Folsomia candida]|uniref:Uncharacterized protein n=1 Tax=Folsomia candida TaxID=158441 RepID=A0A226E2A5_FOLCA|nr:hypothetical protein Fcan01_14459 [Folsomia candida]
MGLQLVREEEAASPNRHQYHHQLSKNQEQNGLTTSSLSENGISSASHNKTNKSVRIEIFEHHSLPEVRAGRNGGLEIRGSSTKLFNPHGKKKLFQKKLTENSEKLQTPNCWDPYERIGSSTSSSGLHLLWDAFQPELRTGYGYKCVTRSTKVYLELEKVDIASDDLLLDEKKKTCQIVRKVRRRKQLKSGQLIDPPSID